MVSPAAGWDEVLSQEKKKKNRKKNRETNKKNKDDEDLDGFNRKRQIENNVTGAS